MRDTWDTMITVLSIVITRNLGPGARCIEAKAMCIIYNIHMGTARALEIRDLNLLLAILLGHSAHIYLTNGKWLPCEVEAQAVTRTIGNFLYIS